MYGELGQLKPVGVCLPVSIFISANRQILSECYFVLLLACDLQPSRFSDVSAENQFWPDPVVLAPPLDPLNHASMYNADGSWGRAFF